MARRHSTGWEVLGFTTDPAPGDPEAIRTLARTYLEIGDGAGEAFDLLGGEGSIRRGKGKAMEALRELIGKELPGMLERTRDSFRDAARAYDGYAGTLTDAQERLDRAIDQAQEVAATASTRVPGPAPDATPDQLRSLSDQQGQVDAAKERLSAAVALGREARQLREDGSRTASVVLDDAAEKAIEERSGIQKFGDFLADNPIIEIIAGIVVGIVAVFLPFVGAVLGAALLAVSLIRMGTQGKFDAGEIIIGLVTLVPGGVLLGAAGKVVGTVAKFAKFAPTLAKLGKGVGTISAGIAGLAKGSTFVRKVIAPLGKGLAGLKVNPAAALAGKVAFDVGNEFTLGLLAAGITAGVDHKKFDVGPAALGSLIGAASGGVLTAFGGTKFANSVKDAFTVKGQFKSNIGKAFSVESAGFAPDGFKLSNVLHVDGKGQAQKTGFHGIDGSTGTDPATGELKTTVSTPDGTVTESTVTPPPAAVAPALPGPPAVATKTTTPDGFTSTTAGGSNTIKTPAGESVTSDGTTTTVQTPLAGPSGTEKAAGVVLGDFAPAPSGQGKPTLTTELSQNGGFTTSGPFGDVTKAPGGGTTISAPGVGGTPPAPRFGITGNTVSVPGGLSVTDGPQSSSVSGGGLTVGNQNGTTSVFGSATPADGALPVVTHNPADGAIGIDVGGTTLTSNTADLNTVGLPDGTRATLGPGGQVTVVGGGDGQIVALPSTAVGGPVTVTDGTVTTTLPVNAGGATTVVSAGGPATTLDGAGFTVNSGGPNPDTVRFNAGDGSLDVTPPGGLPQVSVNAGGDVTAGGVTTVGATGFGTVTDGPGSVEFTPVDLTVGGPDGSTLTITPNGRFDVGGIHQTPDGTVLSGNTTVRPDGSASLASGVDLFDVNPAGQITVTPFGGEPGLAGAPQPTPGNPVTIGNTTVDVDAAGTTTITVTGTDGTTTATVSNGTTTLDSGPIQVTTGPEGVTAHTGGPNPAQVGLGVGGTTQITQGGTTVTAGPDAPVTVGQKGQQPAVTVTPSLDGAPTKVTTSGGTDTTLTDGGAATKAGGTDTAATVDATTGAVTTTASAGPKTTVVRTPDGATVTDSGGTFGVAGGAVTDGGVTIRPNADAGITVTSTAPGGNAATVGTGGITSQGVTTSVDPQGKTVFTTPGDNGPTTAVSAPDGKIVVREGGGSTAAVPPPRQNPDGTAGPAGVATLTSPNGGTVTSDGQTFTHSADGFTTTVTPGHDGPTTSTVHDPSGIGHTVTPANTATVQNSPSGSTITATGTQGTVVTPPRTGPLFGHPESTGGQNTLTGGQPGVTVTTHGTDPVAEPGSTVTHDVTPGHEGEFTTTYGPAQGTFAPGGVTGLGPSGAGVDTAGNPVGTAPGQTPIGTATGDGHGLITVPTPGGGPTLHHDGFFGGKTSVDTGDATLTKSPGGQENASTAGQQAGVVDGPANPAFAGPQPGPETFTASGNNGGPGVDVPVGGKGGSVVHDGNGQFDVRATGGGTFEVSVPGGGPGDTVAVGSDGTLTGPGVTGPAQHGVPQVTLSNNATITPGPGGPVIAPAGGGPTTTITGGTATTVDHANGVTITQHPQGNATFTSNTSTFQLGNTGVDGTVTTGTGPGQATFTVGLGDSGAVKVKDGTGTTVGELDPAGSFNQQHSPAHDYFAHAGGTTPVTDLRAYGYEALTSVLKGAFGQTVGSLYSVLGTGADLETTLENSGVKIGNGVGNSLAGKKLENAYGFKTGGLEDVYTSIPLKTLGGLNNNADTDALNPT